MINRFIDIALRNRFIVVALYLGLAGWGWWALTATPIDAIPDDVLSGLTTPSDLKSSAAVVAVYFRWFESARMEYFARVGWPEIERETGIGPILHSTAARFRAPVEMHATAERFDVFGRNGDVAHAAFERRAGIARCDQDLGHVRGLDALPGERVLAAAAADDQYLHCFILAVGAAP